MDLGGSGRDDTAAADIILAFAAGVVAAPNLSDRTAEDAPDDFERIVAIIAARIAGLPLSLPALARIASGLEPFGDADWGRSQRNCARTTRTFPTCISRAWL